MEEELHDGFLSRSRRAPPPTTSSHTSREAQLTTPASRSHRCAGLAPQPPCGLEPRPPPPPPPALALRPPLPLPRARLRCALADLRVSRSGQGGPDQFNGAGSAPRRAAPGSGLIGAQPLDQSEEKGARRRLQPPAYGGARGGEAWERRGRR